MIRLPLATVPMAASWSAAGARPATLGGLAEVFLRASEPWAAGGREDAGHLSHRGQLRTGLDMVARRAGGAGRPRG